MNATATMTTQMAKTIDAAVMKLSRTDDPDAIKAATEFSKQLLAELGLPAVGGDGLPAINEAAPKTAAKKETKTKPAEKPVEAPEPAPEPAAEPEAAAPNAKPLHHRRLLQAEEPPAGTSPESALFTVDADGACTLAGADAVTFKVGKDGAPQTPEIVKVCFL
jgi:hypothetical protein